MATYRLFPSTNGPSSPTAYAGNYLAGVVFEVTKGGMWLNGYYHWVPAGGDTVARKFALWNVTAANAGSLISSATVTSGTLTAGQWNYVALGTPVPLSIGTAYVACTGWVAVNGFPSTNNSFGSGNTYSAGITNGPLAAFSDTGGTAAEPYGTSQGLFSSTLGSDPSVHMPNAGSNSANFWMDVQVSTAGPGGYSGSYRLYPNKQDANPATVADSSVNYVVATEIRLSQACTLNKIWYYSPSGTAQLATSADIWSILGADSGSITAGTNSPSWSGAAGSGWVSCSFTSTVLPAGSYKVSVYNNAGSPDGWSAKDAETNYWGTGGAGVNGITWGPLYAPGLAAASSAYNFNGSDGGSTPPFTDGTILAGQCTFAQSGTNIYPYLYVSGLAQNYWADMEVTPAAATSPPTLAVGGRMTSRLAEAYRLSR